MTSLLPLDEAIASIAVIVIVSGSDGWWMKRLLEPAQKIQKTTSDTQLCVNGELMRP